MKDVHGSQEVEGIIGRRIIVSAGKGKTNVEDLVWLKENIEQSLNDIMGGKQ